MQWQISLKDKVIQFQNEAESAYKQQKSLANFGKLILAYVTVIFSTYWAVVRFPFLAIQKLFNTSSEVQPKLQEVGSKNMASVLEENEWVVLDFWAAWCGPCMMMEPAIKSFAEQNPSLCVGKINADTNAEILKQYKIKGLPQILLFHQGKEVKRHAGSLSEQELQAFVQQQTSMECSPAI